MRKNSPFSRREFVKTTSVAAIGAPLILKSSLIMGRELRQQAIK
jgi:hypothetical protein